MNVLHLTTHLNIGGITTYILKLVKPLRARDIKTHVLSSGGECSPQFLEVGAHLHTLPIKTKSELDPKLYVALPKLVRLIRENKIDVLHAHTRVTQVLAFWASKLTGVPVVTTCHGFYKRRLGRRILPAWGDCAIAISQGVADHLHNDFKLPLEKVVLINNGVDLNALDEAYGRQDPARAREAYGFTLDEPVIGSISRLVSDKGHEYLIRAIALLKEEFPKIKLLIVGEGKHKASLQELAASLKLQDNVVFTGNVMDVTQTIAAMDIFALPAIWREGFGLSIAEAMACRKPVIVSNIWALNTLIRNGETGILIEPKNSEILAEALADLIHEPARRKRIGEAARAMVEEHFSILRMAGEIAETYGRTARRIP